MAGIVSSDQGIDKVSLLSGVDYYDYGNNTAIQVTTTTLVLRSEPGENFAIGHCSHEFQLLSDITLTYVGPLP